MSLDLMSWSRSTYSILDWLGDLGGLFDMLRYFGTMIAAPLSTFALQTTLLTSIFS